jgi:hypothetical protein
MISALDKVFGQGSVAALIVKTDDKRVFLVCVIDWASK